MKIYDVTMPISEEMLVWRGDDPVSIKAVASVKEDGVAVSQLTLSSHTGTHVDAPSHFLENSTGVDIIDPEKLIGDCIVVDLTDIDHQEITVKDLESIDLTCLRVVFKTGNFKYLKQNTFPDKYISLSVEGAKYLVDKGIVLVGTDFLGIEKEKNPGHPVHTTLLEAGIVNVEGLDLSEVPAGEYQIICAPLKIKDCDGAPSRVFLIKN